MSLLLLTRGRSANYDVLVTDDTGVPMDITDVDLRFIAKASFRDADVDAVLNLTSEIEKAPQTGDTIGRATVHVPATAVSGLDDRIYRLVWECVAEYGSGRFNVDAGVLIIAPEVAD